MILLVDKPAGMTSQRVVSCIKRASAEKLKIGHTGTLDPMCTGLLPVLTGRDTKLNPFFPHTKAYTAIVRFGIKTDTGDITGETVATSDLPDAERVRTVLPEMVGPCMQTPPMYSAVHVDGKRLYELAREGIEIERPSRAVELFDLKYIEQISDTEHRFSVSCSSGTYIRTLCEDIGVRLGVCATMAALRRTESNGFKLRDAHRFEDVLQYAQSGRLSELSLTAENAFSCLPRVTVPGNAVRFYCNGGAVAQNRLSPTEHSDGLFRAYSESDVFLGLLSLEHGFAKAAFLAEST